MTIDDSVFIPVAARTNLYRDEARDTWRIRIPERANIALDTVVAYAYAPRRNHPRSRLRGRGRHGARDVFAFLALIGVLLFRPHGLFGQKERRA